MESTISKKEFLAQIQDLIEREQSIVGEDQFRDYEEWDSLAYLSVVAFIDEKYHVIIPFEIFRDFQKVSDIYQYVQNNIKEQKQ